MAMKVTRSKKENLTAWVASDDGVRLLIDFCFTKSYHAFQTNHLSLKADSSLS